MHPLVKVPVNQNGIPPWLKAHKQWLCWAVGKAKPNGKFDKIPVNPLSGSYVDGTKPDNWMSFEDAIRFYEHDLCDGVGFALSKDPFDTDGSGNLYLVALDFDQCIERAEEIKAIWKSLNKPYAEISPSGNGIRMFVLSRKLLAGGNDGDGHEMYSHGRFMTVTGNVIGGCNV